jgi:hypothetical protein
MFRWLESMEINLLQKDQLKMPLTMPQPSEQSKVGLVAIVLSVYTP